MSLLAATITVTEASKLSSEPFKIWHGEASTVVRKYPCLCNMESWRGLAQECLSLLLADPSN
jgi:hypothetical protein